MFPKKFTDLFFCFFLQNSHAKMIDSLRGSWWFVNRLTTLSLTENVIFNVEAIYDSYGTFVFSSRLLINRIYSLIAFIKAKYMNCDLRSAVIFQRHFPHSTLYFQEQ